MNISSIINGAGNAVESKIIKRQGKTLEEAIAKGAVEKAGKEAGEIGIKKTAGAIGGSINGGLSGAAGGAVVGGVVGALDDDQTVLGGMGKGALIGGGVGAAANGIAGGIRGSASLTENASAVAKAICRFGTKQGSGLDEEASWALKYNLGD